MLALCAALTLSMLAQVPNAAAAAPARSEALLGIEINPERNAFYGDLHLHTSYSFDVYLSTNITPDEAYRFARGESVLYQGRLVKRSTLPLDFLAVTDHAENLGVFNTLDVQDSPLSKSKFGQLVGVEGSRLVGRTIVRLFDGVKHLSSVVDVDRDLVDGIARDAWQREIDAANRNYEPGRFTTFIGYEWTSQPGMQNLHRNIIFRGSNAPMPFSAADSVKPEDLWGFIERARALGYEALAIPHNANASNGLMFAWTDSEGDPISPAYARLRAANEPLVEIVQEKGQSETHPTLSSNDEFADFEVLDFEKAFRKDGSSKLGGSYVRDALGRGMEIAGFTGGINPFKVGFVGASDIHSGLSESSEHTAAERAKAGMESGQAEEKRGLVSGIMEQLTSVLPPRPTGRVEEYAIGAPGLTGVWAEQNTRESIFSALQRKETFATSGSRLRFRFFGSWRYGQDLLADTQWLKVAYRNGVPMGGDLPVRPRGKKAPVFALWAVKDPNGANLDRLQVVKVWLKGGSHAEAVYDVVLSDGRKTGDSAVERASPVGNTVDLRTASYTNTIGATELSAVWQDPHFDPAVSAAYYLRVLEIPTPRYSTILAVMRGEALSSGVTATIQERGWSSPIWYTPLDSIVDSANEKDIGSNLK